MLKVRWALRFLLCVDFHHQVHFDCFGNKIKDHYSLTIGWLWLLGLGYLIYYLS